MKYYPEPVPYTDDLPYIREWLGREFANILVAFEGVEMIELVEEHIAPTGPREGMIKYADGVNWDPGNGAGIYAYRDAAWRKLDFDDTDTATFSRLRLTATNDITLSSTLHAFQIGPDNGLNFRIDQNEISWQNNGVAVNGALNITGGDITIGDTASVLNLNGGKINFPNTQQASSDANTLDDYEEGTWTPVITFVTPGDLAVTYSTQIGTYVKIGKMVHAQLVITTSVFTHTTAAGEFRITGLPFNHVTGSGKDSTGSIELQGFTWPGGRTQVNASIVPNGTYVRAVAMGSGLSRAGLGTGDHASGTNTTIVATIDYEAAA
jgi:hypothetical protein